MTQRFGRFFMGDASLVRSRTIRRARRRYSLCVYLYRYSVAFDYYAYDRIKGERGEQIPSAAFDLVTVSTEETGKHQRETAVAEKMKQRQARRRDPTGKRILRDRWLAPMTLSAKSLADDPQVHQGGVRASDKGFLNLPWRDYLALLRWTGKQRLKEAVGEFPAKLQAALTSLGIEASMWRGLVWNFKRYFGRASCAGSPESMAADAAHTGKRFHRCQGQVFGVFCWRELATLNLSLESINCCVNAVAGTASAFSHAIHAVSPVKVISFTFFAACASIETIVLS